jgi:hypothetical protein
MMRLAPWFRSACRVLTFAAVPFLAACVAPSGAPGTDSGGPDPALQGHARWCGTSPPSGYCDIDDHR